MITIIIPTIRPEKIPLLLEKIEEAVSLPHEVLWEEDIEGHGAPKMVKKLVDKATFDWVVFLGDDTLPEKDSIDTIFKYATDKSLMLVGFNDHHGQRATHWIAHKELLNDLENREFFYTGYIHNFCDDELRVRTEKMGLYGWCEAAGIIHSHPAFGTAKMDPTYEVQVDKNNWQHDQSLFASRNCKLTVALIVKNEEAMLARCLESVKGADEIIVVDTGSIDKTKEIAAQYTDKIYDFEWCDDFSKARNFAKGKSTGDWILSIDADEFLDEGGIEAIRALLFTPKHAIGIQMKCITGKYYVPRLFRNIPAVWWEGRIHEVINTLGFDYFDIGITYESSPAHIYDLNRNLRILEKSHVDDPENTRVMFYLAREYAYYKEWDKAEQMFEKYFLSATWLPERADAYFMLAVCYWHDGKGNGEKTRENCFKAISLNSNFKAPIMLMAIASFEKNAKQWRRMAETADNSDTLFARDQFDTI